MTPREIRKRPARLAALAVVGLVAACGSSTRNEPSQTTHGAGAPGMTGGAAGRGGAGSSGTGSGGKNQAAGRSNAGAGGTNAAGTGGTNAGGSGGSGKAGNGSGASGGSQAGKAGSSGAGEGGVPDEAGGGAGAPNAGPFEPFIDAFCETARTCCEAASMPLGPLTACESAFPGRTDLIALVDKGTVTVDEAKLATCVAAFATAASDCDWSAVNADCHGLFKGTLADGQPCTDAFECDRSSGPKICLMLQNAANPGVGTCETPARAGESAPCLGTCTLISSDCSTTVSNPDESTPTSLCYESDGLFCHYGYGCEKLVADGEYCSGPESCGSDGQCLSACEALSASGEACMSSLDCQHDLVCDGSFCIPEPVASNYTCSGQPPFID